MNSEKIIIASLKENQMVQGFLAIEQVELKTARNNKQFLNFTLSDGELSINAKKWDFAGAMPKSGSVIKIQGSVGQYQGVNQIVIDRWRDVTEADNVILKDFIKRSQLSDEELWDTCCKYIGLIQDADYNKLTKYIYDNYRAQILEAPAALHHHHAYGAGLVEHTLGVTRSALTMADDTTNLSLLIAGAMLHDIGKIDTYKFDGLAIQMTDIGQLLEHISRGSNIVFAICSSLDIPREKAVLVQHMILSHHGKLEWGSPVSPKFKEAYILHQADMANVVAAKLDAMYNEVPVEDTWSPYMRDLGTSILVPKNGEYVIDIK